jgi:hypothetical protein
MKYESRMSGWGVQRRGLTILLVVLWLGLCAGSGFALTPPKVGPQVRNPDPPCFDNANRYVDCKNGTVTDTVTGIVWLKNADCLQGPRDYKTASDFAARLSHGRCGLRDKSNPGDWRLPTKEEWAYTVRAAVSRGCFFFTLTDRAGTACYANDPVFTAVSFSYWTSSAHESQPGDAWAASLIFGVNGFETKQQLNWVWPIRSSR